MRFLACKSLVTIRLWCCADLPQANTTYSRTTPAIDPDNGVLVLGTQSTTFDPGTGHALGVNMHDDTLLWRTSIYEHPHAVYTQSGTIHNGSVVHWYLFCRGVAGQHCYQSNLAHQQYLLQVRPQAELWCHILLIAFSIVSMRCVL